MLLMPVQVFSHGAWIEWSVGDGNVAIRAVYDDGTPMAGASVTVYPVSNPTEPWLVGETDSLGSFSFMPDESVSSAWDLQVRKAGHGDMVRIDLTGQGPVRGSTAFSTGQIVLMTVCVVWGLIGTGFYFTAVKKRRRDARS
jgi:nickel transport protein